LGQDSIGKVTPAIKRRRTERGGRNAPTATNPSARPGRGLGRARPGRERHAAAGLSDDFNPGVAAVEGAAAVAVVAGAAGAATGFFAATFSPPAFSPQGLAAGAFAAGAFFATGFLAGAAFFTPAGRCLFRHGLAAAFFARAWRQPSSLPVWPQPSSRPVWRRASWPQAFSPPQPSSLTGLAGFLCRRLLGHRLLPRRSLLRHRFGRGLLRHRLLGDRFFAAVPSSPEPSSLRFGSVLAAVS